MINTSIKKMDTQFYSENELNLNTIYDKIHKFLNRKYDIVYNTITNELLIRNKNTDKWEPLNFNDLVIQLTRTKIKFNKSDLEVYLGSSYINKYNPIKNYFHSIEKWDGINHIGNLCSYISTDDDIFFEKHLKKWLVRAVRTALEENFYNKHCIVFVQEQQHGGKSSFCRYLNPPKLKKYIAENISADKDGLIQLGRNLIINLDEIDKLSNYQINAYKSMFSKTSINIRQPYAKTNSVQIRCCSFIGSTNIINFLKDKTGNVRWICIELLDRINFDYSKDIDINKVWSQAVFLSKDKKFNCNLTKEDIEENELRNSKYISSGYVEDLISQFFEKSTDRNDFFTASQIAEVLRNIDTTLKPIEIGKNLNKMGFKRINGGKNRVKGYMIKRKV